MTKRFIYYMLGVLGVLTIVIAHCVVPVGSMTRNNGLILAKALDTFFEENGYFPETLDQLIPNYITDLNEPESMWGWLYHVDDSNHYTLGYVLTVERYGYSVCILETGKSEWRCEINSPALFDLPPTPTDN